jgi:hypothetical protein
MLAVAELGDYSVRNALSGDGYSAWFLLAELLSVLCRGHDRYAGVDLLGLYKDWERSTGSTDAHGIDGLPGGAWAASRDGR